MSERDCRTIAIEVGMQNAGLASGLAKGLGKIATVGLAPAIFGPLMNTTGSLLASYWHRKPPEDRERRGGGAVAGAVAVVAGLVMLAGCGRTATSSAGADWP